MDQKRNFMRQLEQRKSAREYESWATANGANWSQAYKMASPEIRAGMMSRRLNEKTRQRTLLAQRKSSIANRFGAQGRAT